MDDLSTRYRRLGLIPSLFISWCYLVLLSAIGLGMVDTYRLSLWPQFVILTMLASLAVIALAFIWAIRWIDSRAGKPLR
jgi:hypothetical protein